MQIEASVLINFAWVGLLAFFLWITVGRED